MATYHIIADDTTIAGAELIKTAQHLAQSPDAFVQISQHSEPLTGPAKVIDEGLKELKAILAGKKRGILLEDFIAELKREEAAEL